ncbi:hypothetical protein KZO01_15080 [Kurthia zopfii]|uniref:Restriction endonuclease n=1 Tax=Kurthia zopfii TaxID=1650 RepID=A0A8B4QB44_9BACL|nr:restriction endonuclease [Kurthia zopfii]PWI21677.1 hypothetical protein DF281_10820 [Kurthia zopfii]TDR35759.1 restriction endonuclease [Kurthia zopfii]GEK31199.1 hypothetical protein KZO01_15080 [Kurthia zopfii]STX09912.1 Uncharacterised protein [Kurthia zopfii]
MSHMCEIHNKEQNQVLQEQKIVLYCPECAQENILEIIQLEDQIKLNKLELSTQKIENSREKFLRQIILGMIIALYIQVLPWIFSPFYNEIDSVGSYFLAVGASYQWMWTHGWVMMLSIIFVCLGLYNVKDAFSKLKSLPKTIGTEEPTKKDRSLAVKRFQASFRLNQANEFIQKIHKKYAEQKTTVTPVEVMTEYEMTLYYAKLIQHLGYRDVELTRPLESFGVSMIAKKDGIKASMMVIKDDSRLNHEVISRFGTGRAYFDCEEAIILAPKSINHDAEQFANELRIKCCNMKELEENLTSSKVDAWTQYLDEFTIKTDTDLKRYSMYEKERLIHFSE